MIKNIASLNHGAAATMSQPNPRQPYHTPKLTQYGDIKTLTRNVGVDGEFGDGAGEGAVPNKTQ